MTDDPPQQPTPATSPFDTLGTAACVFLALVTIGFAAFRRLGDALPAGASRNVDRALFTSVNAVTLSGFEQSFAEVPNFPPLGRAILALLAVGGAMTTLVCAGLFLRAIAGMKVSAWTIVALSAATVAVPWLLAVPAGGAYDAASAATSLGLAGQHAFSAAGVDWLVAMSVPAIVGPIALLAVFAGRRGVWPPLRATLVTFAVVYLVSTILLACVGTFDGVPRVQSFSPRFPEVYFRESAAAIGARLHGASTLAVDARGLGLANAWPTAGGAALQWIVVALMALGSAPGGVAAGIGLLPIVLVVRQALLALRGRVDALPAGAALAGVATASIVAWLAALFASLVVLSMCQPETPGDRLLFIVVAALSNVGLSHDPIGFTGVGLYALAATMIVGRLLPLATLAWMASVARRTSPGPNADKRN